MKLFLTILLSLAVALGACAQEFETLCPQDYPVGKVLPAFTTQLILPECVTENDVEIIVEYPEYRPLSNKEIKALKKANIMLSEHLQVKAEFGVERKRSIVDVSFSPFIIKKGKWVRLTSVCVFAKPKMKIQAVQTRSVENRYTDNSVLATGKWVKIAVSEEGVYQITAALAQQWGFNDLSKVKVYGYGGMPQVKQLFNGTTTSPIDDLNEVATFRTDGKLLFFAEGVVRKTWNASEKRWKHETNPYTTLSYYFVTEGEAPQKMQKDEQVQASTSVSEIAHLTLYDADAFAWYEGGKQFYDAYNFATGNTKTYTLKTPDAVNNSASLELAFSASSKVSSTSVLVSSGEKELGRFNIRYSRDHEKAVDIKQNYKLSDLSESTPIKFTTTQNRDARLNYLSLTYTRKLNATATSYAFVPTPANSAPVALNIDAATTHTQVWRISEEGTISQCPTLLNGTTLTATAKNGKERYVIVDTNKNYQAPTIIHEVENQNLHADKDIHMVIVVPESGKFDAEAERLAEAHRIYNHLTVKVVHQNKIFNEFGSGTPDATAIRRYLKMLYDKATSEDNMPRYLLLFGDCTFDNRMVTPEWKQYSATDYLLAYEDNDNYDTYTENAIGDIVSYPSDDYYGLLDDGEGKNLKTEKVDLGIGRFVCSTTEHAKTLVDKSIAYLQNQRAGSWKNRIVMIGDAPRASDSGDKNAHMEDAERTASTISNASNGQLNIRRIYPDYYERELTATGYRFPKATELLTEEVKRGALMFNYSGHGSPAQISHSYIFESGDWEKVTSTALPLWVLASCEILPFDQDTHDFGRQALFSPNGGAVAVMCASRAVYATENNALNVAFCEALVKRNDNGTYNTFGDALRIAKNKLITSAQDRTINKLKYIIAGDPALRLMQPTLRIFVDSINGTKLNTNDDRMLKAGSIATFCGYIENEPEFTGILTATLYDKEEQLSCRNNGKVADEAFTFSERTKIVFSGSDSVRNGRFKIFIPIPRDISYSNQSARLSLYAINNDAQKEANGYNENFHLNGTEEGQNNDSIGPKIFLYLNEADFPNGGITNSNPLLVARLSDESGINATGTSLGHDIELILDGNTSKLTTLNDYFAYEFGSYQEGTVSYQLENLTPGRHTLSLRAWDHNNNSSTATLDFIVGNTSLHGKKLYATINPARTFTQFVANIAENHIGGTITFEVFTSTGQKVWEQHRTISSTYATERWNLTTSSGTPLPKGLYIFRAKITSEQGVEEMEGERLIII